MRVFVDACVDPRVVEGLAGHYVKTAFELGWHMLQDCELLPLISQRFDVVITIDGVKPGHVIHVRGT